MRKLIVLVALLVATRGYCWQDMIPDESGGFSFDYELYGPYFDPGNYDGNKTGDNVGENSLSSSNCDVALRGTNYVHLAGTNWVQANTANFLGSTNMGMFVNNDFYRRLDNSYDMLNVLQSNKWQFARGGSSNAVSTWGSVWTGDTNPIGRVSSMFLDSGMWSLGEGKKYQWTGLGSNGSVNVVIKGKASYDDATIDYNPMNVPELTGALAFVRQIMSWLIVAGLIFACWEFWDRKLTSAFLTPQAHSAGESVAGTNLSIGGSLLAASAITISLMALPTIMVALFSARGSQVFFNPFNEQTAGAFGAAAGIGLSLLGQVFDVNLAVVAFFNYWAFRLTCTTAVAGVSSAIRFMVGV